MTGLWLAHRRLVKPSGEKLNRLAWEATFRERGLPVPPGGPRDGYWGARLPPWTPDPELGWREAEAHLPGLVEEDASGLQRLERPDARRHLLIVGGSVAWGAYASSLETTYFARLARRLAERQCPVRITVLAAGAWTSEHELKALRHRGLALAPDVVLFLDGLNDFTQGTGSEGERVADYLGRMREARDLACAQEMGVVFALQPILLQKARSPLEERILELSLDPIAEGRLRRGYRRLSAGLRELARRPSSTAPVSSTTSAPPPSPTCGTSPTPATPCSRIASPRRFSRSWPRARRRPSATREYNVPSVTDPPSSGARGQLEAAVRFLQPELNGARRSRLMGKGTLSVEGESLVFEGKRMLAFWAQLLVVVGAAAASMALLGGPGWLIAIAILFFGRLRHRESLPAASIQSVVYERGRHRFLVAANVGAGLQCVAWQTQGDSGPLADALRRQFPGSFQEEAVRGWKTY